MKTEKAIKLIADEIRKGRAGTPVLISALRSNVSMSKALFDAAIRDMIRSKKYFPSVYAHPLAILSDAEKDAMVSNGEGNYFFSINPRENVEIPKTEQYSDIQKTKKRGGYREGAGRPAVKQKIKKQQSGRLPGWIVDWLKSQPGKPAEIIEQALIEKFGLQPPET